MAIYKVMFFEEHINNISFDDAILNIVWKSVKYSMDASIKGFCNKKDTPYDSLFTPLTKGLTKGGKIPLANNEKGKEKEKEKGKPKGYDLFISDLKQQVSIKSKVTKTKEGEVLFKQMKDVEKLKVDYVAHQLDKKEFSQRITAFMEDYKPANVIPDGGDWSDAWA